MGDVVVARRKNRSDPTLINQTSLYVTLYIRNKNQIQTTKKGDFPPIFPIIEQIKQRTKIEFSNTNAFNKVYGTENYINAKSRRFISKSTC